MARYAKRLTKEDLMKGGIVEITEDCKVFGKNGEISMTKSHKQGYIVLTIYDVDAEGNKIKVPTTRTFKGGKKPCDTYVYKTRTIGLHRAMWAWFHNEVPDGMVVDHINNKHQSIEDYYLSNLQLLTPQENITKERECNTKQVPCCLSKPRSFYENRLASYEAMHEEAKKAGDKELCHKLRGNIASMKARIRYWDANKSKIEDNLNLREAYEEAEAQRLKAKHQSIKDRRLLAEYKDMFKEAGNTKMWHEVIRTIKAWDTLSDIQKEHVWDVLHRFFGRGIY